MQYLFVDIEASGLPDYHAKADAPHQPRLAQLGMMFVGSDCEIQSKHEFLIKPRGWMMSAEATRVSGLTTEYLEQHGGPIEPALDLYMRAIESRRVVAGFNLASYDLKVMRGELRRAGKSALFMETKSMCLMATSRPLVRALNKNGAVKQPTMKEACAHFGIDQPNAHSALADAMSVYQIWRAVIATGTVPVISDPYQKPPKKKKAGKSKAERLRGETVDDEDGDDDEIDFQMEIPL